MTPQERRIKIKNLLSSAGFMTVEEISEKIYASEPTVRRDLKILASEGSITRVHGGASYIRHDAYEWPMQTRTRIQIAEKKTICRLAANILEEGDHIFVDTGSTVQYLPDFLPSDIHITLYTHYLPIVLESASHPGIRVECPGGVYDVPHACLTGGETIKAVKTRHADFCFLTASGFTAMQGANLRSDLERDIKIAMIENSDTVVFLLDHTKFGQQSYYQLAEPDKIDIIVTDETPPEDIREACKRHGIDLVYP